MCLGCRRAGYALAKGEESVVVWALHEFCPAIESGEKTKCTCQHATVSMAARNSG